MRFVSAACFFTLLLSGASVLAAPAPRAAGGVRRKAVYDSNTQIYNERVARGQVDTKLLRRYKANSPPDTLLGKQRRQEASPAPGNRGDRGCRYEGPQPDTSQCQDADTSDRCTTGYYEVDETYLQLENGNTLQSGDHVNFRYIPLYQYQGFGSYREPDPDWTILSGGLQIDPNEGQPGAAWIGRDYLDWSAGADLPEGGYCIVWVQVNGVNPHFGEGGQGPVCYCPVTSRRYFH